MFEEFEGFEEFELFEEFPSLTETRNQKLETRNPSKPEPFELKPLNAQH